MDQGILEALNIRYRWKLLLSLVLALEEASNIIIKLQKTDMLDVVEWISESLNQIKHTSLVCSWRKLWDLSGNGFQENREEIVELFEYKC